jgi:hypothetical protein
MTRSHKLNDRDHGVGDTSGGPESQLPRYFAKHGPVDADPKKTKKDGGGKGNWGRDGDELQDIAYNLTNPRRRSNSSSHVPDNFKTKFETRDQEPVFEEEIHGPLVTAAVVGGEDVVSVESTTSSGGGSGEEEYQDHHDDDDNGKKM